MAFALIAGINAVVISESPIREIQLFARAGLPGGISASDIPFKCVTTCAPAVKDGVDCGASNMTCLCAPEVLQDDLSPCFDCIAQATPSLLSSLQTAAETIVQGCNAAGVDADDIEVDGGDDTEDGNSGESDTGGTDTGDSSTGDSSPEEDGDEPTETGETSPAAATPAAHTPAGSSSSPSASGKSGTTTSPSSHKSAGTRSALPVLHSLFMVVGLSIISSLS